MRGRRGRGNNYKKYNNYNENDDNNYYNKNYNNYNNRNNNRGYNNYNANINYNNNNYYNNNNNYYNNYNNNYYNNNNNNYYNNNNNYHNYDNNYNNSDNNYKNNYRKKYNNNYKDYNNKNNFNDKNDYNQKNKKRNNYNNVNRNRKQNNNQYDKEKDEELKMLKDSFKTKELQFLKDVFHTIKLEESEKLYNEFFKIEKIQNKIKEIFDIKDVGDIFRCIFNLFYKIIDNFKLMNEKRLDSEKKNLNYIKNIYYDAYDALVLLIQKEYIKKNESKEIKTKAIEEFKNLMNKLPESLFNILDKYIFIYNIEKELNDYINTFKDFNEFSNKYNNNNALLYIIKKFNLQNKYSFINFKLVPEKNEIFYNLIQNLYCTYNISSNMLTELNEYIKKNVEKKYFELFTIRKIFKANNNNPEFNDEIKKFIIDYLLYFDKKNSEEKELKKYYSLLIDNKIEYLEKETNILSIENINSLIKNQNYYKTAFYLIKKLDKSQLEKIDDDILDIFIDNFTAEQKKEIKEFIELFPNKIKDIINHFKENNELKELLGILKYAKKVDVLDDETANQINQKKYHGILLNKFKRNYQEKKQYYSIIDFITKSEEYFHIFFPLFKIMVKENKQEIDLKVIYTIIDIALKNNFKISNNILKRYKYKKEDVLEFKDVFGPHTEDCLCFNKEQINVIFIDKVADLKLYGDKFFKNDKNEFIGFDSEWVDKINCKEKTETAIVQLSDYDGKNILILDMINLNKDKNFIEIFKEVFTNKKFIGFDLRDDLLNLPNDIQNHLKEKNELIDLKNIYKITTFESAKNFSEICKEFFGKPLCKYEQCSNWEMRPLRQSQLHYAALDAIYCCLVFKKLKEYKS